LPPAEQQDRIALAVPLVLHVGEKATNGNTLPAAPFGGYAVIGAAIFILDGRHHSKIRGDRPLTQVTAPRSEQPTVVLRTPYLLFLGDAPSAPYAKTAFGIRDWAPHACLGQMRLPGTTVDLGLPEMTPESAAAAGAGSFLIGVAPVGGKIPPEWTPILRRALAAGLDIVSGMHTPLAGIEGLAAEAKKTGAALVDVRIPKTSFEVGSGRKRTGKRLLTVGTDCALGKKYTALALTNALRAHGVKATFRATGQTGVMIAGSGIAIDAVVSDFIAGAAEALSPDAAADHWDCVEGQGSLFHPSYAAVTLGLLHGSQPDVLILCHDPTRTHIKSSPDFPIPDLRVAAARYIEAGQLTNPKVRLAGVSLNTSELSAAQRERVLADTAALLGVPCFDPLKSSLDDAVRSVLK
jgi:uncharacterized NAD-dependent epimerase/dehydratase family protein